VSRPSAGRSARRGRRPLPTLAETSAGGLVVRAEPGSAGADHRAGSPQVVLIGRRTRHGSLEWVLPKGHVEAGESIEAAARREVREETGIDGRVLEPLGTVDYWFVAEGVRVHKTVHHFLLAAQSGRLSHADPEVDEVAWLGLDEALERLSHADERGILERAAALLAERA
jgi:8-oxo-dGTP pyrophosphatase MutT (NUDIX family)